MLTQMNLGYFNTQNRMSSHALPSRSYPGCRSEHVLVSELKAVHPFQNDASVFFTLEEVCAAENAGDTLGFVSLDQHRGRAVVRFHSPERTHTVLPNYNRCSTTIERRKQHENVQIFPACRSSSCEKQLLEFFYLSQFPHECLLKGALFNKHA